MTTPAEKFAAAKVRNHYKETTAFVQSFDFEFDPFQVAACHAVEEGSGVLVAAPTGAGKTVVGEFAAHLALKLGKKCFYTTPIKALKSEICRVCCNVRRGSRRTPYWRHKHQW